MHVTPICRLIAHSGCQYDQSRRLIAVLGKLQWNLSYLDPNYPDSRLTELRK